MNKERIFIGILLVLLLAGSSVVSARSSYDIMDYAGMMDRYGNYYDASWNGPYKGGTLYVNMQGPRYDYYEPRPTYCSSLGCYRNMWSYDDDFYGPQKVYPTYPRYIAGNSYPTYAPAYSPSYEYESYSAPSYTTPSYTYTESVSKAYAESYTKTVQSTGLYADRYYSGYNGGYRPNNFRELTGHY